MLQFRPIAGDGELRAFRRVVLGAFGIDLPVDDEALARGDASFRALLDLDRAVAAFDGDELVAGSGTFDLELAICGGTLAMGGLTMVAVKASHRRRGILRRFISAHLDGCAERGQAVSGLWASEAAIYGRFGFGPVGDAEALEIEADKVTLVDGAGGDAIRLHVDAANEPEAREAAIAVYERVWATRPGMFARTGPWWTERIFNTGRPGASPNRARMAIARRGDELTGYVAFKQLPGGGGQPGGHIEIIELIAVDPTAEASLWRFILDVDLFRVVKWWNAPVDCLGPWLTPARRRFRRHVTDHLWLRVNDVRAALEARAYAADGALTFAVAGDRAVWSLRVADGRGTCAPAAGEPDLVFDLDALGSIYLGGVSPRLLWRAGRVRGSADAVARAERIFAWPVLPWCAEVF